MKILDFFLFLWVIFALLDPDPATQINADPDADPDPKPWFVGLLLTVLLGTLIPIFKDTVTSH
jgi:hypothetical protein